MVSCFLLQGSLAAGVLLAGGDDLPGARISVDATCDLGAVNPLVFGQNIEAGDQFGIFTHYHTPSNDGEGLWDPQARDFVPRILDLAGALRMGALRYPGGCLAHNFNWKAAVGPLAERPEFQFGIDEWIKLCRRLGAEPVYTVSDYYGTAEEAAELVEYLNAPATPAHPWAMKRAGWGHPEPYGVRWFELGNESDHGNHWLKPARTFTPSQYAAWARDYAAKMRAVDPSIRLGIVTPPGNGRHAESDWNRTVFREAGAVADFVVVHFYAPEAGRALTDETLPLMNQACMAETDQLGLRMRQYRDEIRKASGRDLPLAITEYNTWAATTEQPVPYRFSFAAALQSADFIRLCLEPSQARGVVMAEYWQMFNGWWGAVRSGGAVLHPAYALYRLWGRSRGDTVLPVSVSAPRAGFAGFRGISPARGDRYVPAPDSSEVPRPAAYPARPITLPGVGVRSTADGFSVELAGFKGEAYPQLFSFANPADFAGGVSYRFSFEARMKLEDGESRDGLGEFGLGLEDARGWAVTKSSARVVGVEKAADWKKFSGAYRMPAGGKTARALVRLIARRPVTGTMEVRNLSISVVQGDVLPAYPLLTAAATRSTDGGSIHLVVFNKSLDRALATSVTVAGFDAASARYEQLTSAGGPESIAPPKEAQGEVTISKDGHGDAGLTHVFPPCSMTAITILRKTN